MLRPPFERILSLREIRGPVVSTRDSRLGAAGNVADDRFDNVRLYFEGLIHLGNNRPSQVVNPRALDASSSPAPLATLFGSPVSVCHLG